MKIIKCVIQIRLFLLIVFSYIQTSYSDSVKELLNDVEKLENTDKNNPKIINKAFLALNKSIGYAYKDVKHIKDKHGAILNLFFKSNIIKSYLNTKFGNWIRRIDYQLFLLEKIQYLLDKNLIYFSKPKEQTEKVVSTIYCCEHEDIKEKFISTCSYPIGKFTNSIDIMVQLSIDIVFIIEFVEKIFYKNDSFIDVFVNMKERTMCSQKHFEEIKKLMKPENNQKVSEAATLKSLYDPFSNFDYCIVTLKDLLINFKSCLSFFKMIYMSNCALSNKDNKLRIVENCFFDCFYTERLTDNFMQYMCKYIDAIDNVKKRKSALKGVSLR